MSNVTGKLQSGTYRIKNVDSGAFATLPDANTGSAVIASKDTDNDDTKWNITLLSSDKYLVANYVFANYAYVGAAPSSGDRVAARSDQYQWVIKETSTKGQYLIYPNNNDSLFWGLVSGTDKTAVKLDSAANDKDKWNFIRAQA
ncbi:hypothetical protein JAAARDRAFT_196963 [Jaapia argillacea MUCL 33604]|uniref:Ricin B lectin domain-containing protein n=1 Tax=Jaapia argillacea MUCL 33604 TaxID=933084 RepID=A0A067PJ23_9AGAM|nr:hypothetical protein JAAARDRAFT_196963 [Jaapia argillacea MUCL 33604]